METHDNHKSGNLINLIYKKLEGSQEEKYM